MRLRLPVPFALAALSLTASRLASADTLGPGSNDYGVVSTIGKGVKELDVGSLLVVGYDKARGASSFRGVALAGAGFRYFVANNVGVSLDANFLYRRSGSGAAAQTDVGGLALVSAGYYASLGGGLFLVPQVGVGGLYGGRTDGQDPSAVRSKLVAGAGDAGLGLAFYPSRHFSVRAGPDALMTFGKATENVSGKSTSLLSVDAGFRVGLGYVF